MKKLCLLFSATLVALFATAQQRNNSVVFTDNAPGQYRVNEPVAIPMQPSFARTGKHTAASDERTTSGATSRWYNYGDYLHDASSVNFAALYLWNDTTSMDAYSSGTGSGTVYQFNDMVSIGMITDPFFSGWNDPIMYSGMMQLTPSNAYTIDSVFVSGIYYRNNANTTPVDTLTIAVLYGDGNTSSDLHYKAIDTTGGRSWIHDEYGQDSLFYTNMHFDSVNNHADTFQGGFTPVIKKLYLTNTDTSADFQAVIPVSINVPAGNRPAVSLSFKSGDASFTFGDSVFISDGITPKYKYGMFRPFLAYEGISGSIAFPANTKDNLNEGEFRDQGANRAANNLYRPMWFWYNATTGGASDYQYPYFAFHISCPTCSAVGVNDVAKNETVVKVFPNPANNDLTVTCNVANASVTLVNMLGQQVATAVATNSKAVLNIAGLSDGMYVYIVNYNGARTIGRFVVAH